MSSFVYKCCGVLPLLRVQRLRPGPPASHHALLVSSSSTSHSVDMGVRVRVHACPQRCGDTNVLIYVLSCPTIVLYARLQLKRRQNMPRLKRAITLGNNALQGGIRRIVLYRSRRGTDKTRYTLRNAECILTKPTPAICSLSAWMFAPGTDTPYMVIYRQERGRV